MTGPIPSSLGRDALSNQIPPIRKGTPCSKRIDQWANRFGVAICLLGALCRIIFFSFNKNLWLDEATTCLNIVNRSYRGLTNPLDFGQMAPLGFLWVAKFSRELFGDYDLALRLPSLLAGLAAILLFYKVVREWIPAGGIGSCFALTLFALNRASMDYVAQAKVYEFDVLCAVVLLLFGTYAIRQMTSGAITRFGICGVITSWFSFPCCFLIGGIGLVLVAAGWKGRHHGKQLAWAIAANLAAAISFLCHYSLFARTDLSGLRADWSQAWLRLAPHSGGDVLLTLQLLWQGLRDPLGFPPAIGTAIFVVAAFDYIRRRDRAGVAVGVSVLLGMAGSWIVKYPWTGRFLLFLVPSTCLIGGTAIQWLSARLRHGTLCSVLLAGLILAHPAYDVISRTVHPFKGQGLTEVMTQLIAKNSHTTQLYIDDRSTPVFQFYNQRYSYSPPFQIAGGFSYMDSDEKRLQRLMALKGKGLLWVIFPDQSIGGIGHRESVLQTLDSIGSREDAIVLFFASAYCYRL